LYATDLEFHKHSHLYLNNLPGFLYLPWYIVRDIIELS